MNPTSNKKDFEDLTTNLKDLAFAYLEKYSPSKQQLKTPNGHRKCPALWQQAAKVSCTAFDQDLRRQFASCLIIRHDMIPPIGHASAIDQYHRQAMPPAILNQGARWAVGRNNHSGDIISHQRLDQRVDIVWPICGDQDRLEAFAG